MCHHARAGCPPRWRGRAPAVAAEAIISSPPSGAQGATHLVQDNGLRARSGARAADDAEIEEDGQHQVLACTIPIYSHLRPTGNLAALAR
jgi:hypothetical protein